MRLLSFVLLLSVLYCTLLKAVNGSGDTPPPPSPENTYATLGPEEATRREVFLVSLMRGTPQNVRCAVIYMINENKQTETT